MYLRVLLTILTFIISLIWAIFLVYCSYQITLRLFSSELWGDEAVKGLNGLTLMFPLFLLCVGTLLFVGSIWLLDKFSFCLKVVLKIFNKNRTKNQ